MEGLALELDLNVAGNVLLRRALVEVLALVLLQQDEGDVPGVEDKVNDRLDLAVTCGGGACLWNILKRINVDRLLKFFLS